MLLSCAFGGFISWGLYLFLGISVESDVTRYFLVSMALTFYAEIMARVKKTPDTVYIVCAAIPLIPGGSLYNTMHYAAEGRWEDFSETGLYTLLLAAAIAVGILCMMTILHVISVFLKNARDVSRTCTEKADIGFRKADRTLRALCSSRRFRNSPPGGSTGNIHKKDERNQNQKDGTGEQKK